MQHCTLCLSEQTQPFFEKIDPYHGKIKYWQCVCCQLIFLAPEFHLSLEKEKARYDTHQNNPNDKNYLNFLNRLAQPLSLKLEVGFSGLDFGCGPGPAMDVVLQEKEVVVENYDPLYFPNRSLLQSQYDFITCSETIEHFYHPRKEFELLDRLLKPKKSYLGIMTEVYESGLDFSSWWYHRDPTHVSFYQKETFDWIAEWQGWQKECPTKNVILFSK